MKDSNLLMIKRHFSVIPHSANQVELRSGVWNPTSYIINDESNTGRLFSILKALDGSATTYEIAKKYSISRAEVESILDYLQQLNVLEASASSAIDYYFGSLDLQSSPVEHRSQQKLLIIGEPVIAQTIQSSVAHFIPVNNIEILNLDNPFIKNLQERESWLFDGLELQEIVEQYSSWQDCFIVLALAQNNPILAMRLNQINHMLGVPWMHGAIDGPFLLIGPTFSVKPGPCYHCFEKRVAMNLREHASYQRYKEALVVKSIHQSACMMNPLLVNLLASHMSLEIINYYLTRTCFTKSKLLSIYLPTMEICFSEVLRLSGCQVCGAVAHRDDQQLYFDYQTILEGIP